VIGVTPTPFGIDNRRQVRHDREVAEVAEPTGDPGVLIGRGRAADVYALDDHRVLRRYRTPYSCTAEADLMRYLRQAGYPVPAVFAADGGDLVMERLDGRDMLADLASRPWRVARHARVLARLHDQLHQIAAPAGLRRPFGVGDRIMHLDLHPGNVMLTAGGPVVIDWTNAAVGPAGADVAMAYLIMASSDLDDVPAWLRPVAGGLRRMLVRRFRAAARDDPGPYLAQVARYRIKDVNVRPAEAARLRQLAEGAVRGPEGNIRGDADR
jgi:aminoglycoside phosphotransferase (APT) family kinase protein